MIDKRSSHGCHVGVFEGEEGIYAAGGRDDSGNDLASAEFYNPATDTWKALGPLNTARVYSPMTMLGQKLIVSGGSPHYLTSVEAWDGTGWDEVDNLKVGRASLSIKFNLPQLTLIYLDLPRFTSIFHDLPQVTSIHLNLP